MMDGYDECKVLTYGDPDSDDPCIIPVLFSSCGLEVVCDSLGSHDGLGAGDETTLVLDEERLGGCRPCLPSNESSERSHVCTERLVVSRIAKYRGGMKRSERRSIPELHSPATILRDPRLLHYPEC